APTELPLLRPIRIDATTAGLFDARFDVEEAPGEDHHLLLGEQAHADGLRTLLGKPTSCVGCEREVVTFIGLYDECVGEFVARAVLVVGVVGVGKLRLRYEVDSLLRKKRPAPQIWSARGDPMMVRSSFGLIVPMVRRAASIQDGE